MIKNEEQLQFTLLLVKYEGHMEHSSVGSGDKIYQLLRYLTHSHVDTSTMKRVSIKLVK